MRFLLAGLLLASSAIHADGLVGLYGGIERWSTEPSGELTPGANALDLEDELNQDDTSANSVYVGLDLPLLPGLMLKHTSLSSDSNGNGSGQLNNTSFNGNLDTELDLSYIDGVIYAEVLDNVVELDLGLTVRKFDGEVTVRESSSNGNQQTVVLDATLPMLYGHARVNLPFTGLAAGVRLNYIDIDDNQLRDSQAYLRYSLPFVPLADIALEAGLRDWRLVLEDLDDLAADFRIKGPYFGLNAAF